MTPNGVVRGVPSALVPLHLTEIAEPKGGGLGLKLFALVFDGIVEVFVGGRWRSGPETVAAAVGYLPEEPPPGVASAAISYGLACRSLNPRQVMRRLYDFGRRPLSPSRLAYLEGQLNVSGGGWFHDAKSRQGAWMYMRRRGLSPGVARFKQYLLVDDNWLGPAVRDAVQVWGRSGAAAVKVASPSHLGRPDRAIAYFAEREHLKHSRRELKDLLNGVDVLPLPLACPGSGVTAWGCDPPRPVWTSAEVDRSWRAWLATMMAAAIQVVRSVPTTEAAWTPEELVCLRLQLGGLSVRDWQPTARLLEEWWPKV